MSVRTLPRSTAATITGSVRSTQSFSVARSATCTNAFVVTIRQKRVRSAGAYRKTPQSFDERWYSVVRRRKVKGSTVPVIDVSLRGVTDADGFLQHGLEHRLEVARRAADDLQNFGCGCLLL